MPDIYGNTYGDTYGSGATGTTGTYTTRPSSVFGGGFQNAGCFAPAGVGHQWLSITGGDVGGFAVTSDSAIWRPANTNLLNRNKQRVSCVEGSRTTANRIYAFTSSNDGLGTSAGFFLRGTFNLTTGLIDWVTVATLTSGAQAGNVGDNHPRQVGRTMALDEANDTAVIGTINGLATVTGISTSSGTVTYRALAGFHVTGVVLDPTNTNIAYCTVDNDGTAGSAGVHRVVNIRTGTVSSTQYTTLTDPQDIQIASVGGTLYCWVAAFRQGIHRWAVSATVTTGWTDLTGTLPVTQGWAGVDVYPGSSLGTTKVIASTADSAATAVDAGAWSTNGGSTWSRESLAWTINTVPYGMADPWWLESAQVQALLNGNTYESECPRINPADTTMLHFHGRSGVWVSTDSAVNWRPSVNGQCVSGGISVGFDPANTNRAVVGDNDWDFFRSSDEFSTMPDPEDPVTGASTWDIAFRPSGKLAIASGSSSNTLGEVYTTTNLWATTVTWTSNGFGTAGGGARCKAVAIGQDAGATEVILAVIEGSGIYRKVGGAAPTLVSSLVTATQTTLPKFCWPGGGTGQYVYLSAANGLFRSTDYGATWASIWSYTQAYEQVGNIACDPTTSTTLYVTVDDNGSNVGLYKITNASTTPVTTKIGPSVDPPGQVAVNPSTGLVYLATTMDTAGGPKLYRSPIANPTAATTFNDITDAQWAAGVMLPKHIAVSSVGVVLVANGIGGYFVNDNGDDGGGSVVTPPPTPSINIPDVSVEVAFDTAPLSTSPIWTNITPYVILQEGELVITRGRPDEFSSSQPGTLNLWLDNSDGRFTRGLATSQYYPNVKNGKRIRVSIVYNGVTYRRFDGHVNNWPTTWRVTGSNPYIPVQITAVDRFDRLNKRGELRSVIEEEYLRDVTMQGTRGAAYYPLSEASGSDTAGNITPHPQGSAFIVTFTGEGDISFGSGTGPGTDELSAVQFQPTSPTNGGKYLQAEFYTPVGGNSGLTLEAFMLAPRATNTRDIVSLETSQGRRAELSFDVNGKLVGFTTGFNGVKNYTLTSANIVNNNSTHHVALTESITNPGTLSAVITARLYMDGVQVASTSYFDTAIETYQRVYMGGEPVFGQLFEGTLSHVAAYSTALTASRILTHAQAGLTSLIERTDQRIARIADWIGIPTTDRALDVGDGTVGWQSTSGQQPIDSMQEVEASEGPGSTLFISGDNKFTFHKRSRRYNANVFLTLDAQDAAQIGRELEFPGDDFGVFNDVSVDRARGSQSRWINQASIDEFGLYRTSISTVAEKDSQAQAIAQWITENYGSPRTRTPNVTCDLYVLATSNTSLTTTILTTEVSHKVRLTNLPPEAPVSTLDIFVEGSTETINVAQWDISFACSPADFDAVWQLGVVGLSELGITTKLAL